MELGALAVERINQPRRASPQGAMFTILEIHHGRKAAAEVTKLDIQSKTSNPKPRQKLFTDRD